MGDVTLYTGHFYLKHNGKGHFLQEQVHSFVAYPLIAMLLVNGEMFHIHEVLKLPIRNQTDGIVEIAYQQAVELFKVVGIGALQFIIPPLVFRKSGVKQFLYEKVEGMFGGDGL